MLKKITNTLDSFQDEDPSEPALFRLLVKKPDSDFKELAYISRYRTAYSLELLTAINIPIVILFFMKSRPNFNPSISSRKRFRFLGSFIFVSQLNLFLIAQYFRKIKRYPFEDELMLRYYKELQTINSAKPKSK